MPKHDDCARDEDFKRLEGMITKVFAKMDNFIEALHGSMLADATRAARVAQIERDLIRSFKEIDDAHKDIKALDTWRQRFEGGFRVMVAIPVVCTILTTLIALYQMKGG